MTYVNPVPEQEQTAVTLMGAVLMGARQTLLEEDWGGLRLSHVRVIGAVPPEGVTISELANRVGMTKQGCGQFVRLLEQSGHLVLERPESDRRQRVVRRTPLGHRMLQRAVRRQRAMEGDWAAQVGERRYRAFRAVLEDLAQPSG